MKTKSFKQAPGTAGRNAVGHPVEGEIERLQGQNVHELRDYWRRRFRKEPPPIQSSDVLYRLIAWRLQVEAFGDLDAETKRTLARLMRTMETKGTIPASTFNRLRAGTVLVREWRGVTHRVLVLDDGFEYQDKRYRSLTEIARAITGTRWSGPRFFGLEENGGSKEKEERS